MLFNGGRDEFLKEAFPVVHRLVLSFAHLKFFFGYMEAGAMRTAVDSEHDTPVGEISCMGFCVRPSEMFNFSTNKTPLHWKESSQPSASFRELNWRLATCSRKPSARSQAQARLISSALTGRPVRAKLTVILIRRLSPWSTRLRTTLVGQMTVRFRLRAFLTSIVISIRSQLWLEREGVSDWFRGVGLFGGVTKQGACHIEIQRRAQGKPL